MSATPSTFHGKYAHTIRTVAYKGAFRSGLVAVTYNDSENDNYTRTDLLLLSIRASDFSGSQISLISTAQENTGTPGEIQKTEYSLEVGKTTLDFTLHVVVSAMGRQGKITTTVIPLA